MPGFEFFGEEEKKEVNEVLETGILMRYGFDGPRKGIWKSKELEAAVCATFGAHYAQLTSSGTAALTTAMAALGIGAGDEVIISDPHYACYPNFIKFLQGKFNDFQCALDIACSQI